MTNKLGSVVSLESGGPLMTVGVLGKHSDARCSLFVDQALEREWFALIALQPQDVSKSGLSSGARKVLK
ncbi:DUF2158 domain-containing protein [uncultured Planktomarina sp.]|jgi:uncharacterized protein YodC (DUF2158 family)|uniref:DUF2158 domain-containing protein n=1 Tax=uncultured Planktomarina sp. TaxID=1538529 RepID=UPI0032618D73